MQFNAISELSSPKWKSVMVENTSDSVWAVEQCFHNKRVAPCLFLPLFSFLKELVYQRSVIACWQVISQHRRFFFATEVRFNVYSREVKQRTEVKYERACIHFLPCPLRLSALSNVEDKDNKRMKEWMNTDSLAECSGLRPGLTLFSQEKNLCWSLQPKGCGPVYWIHMQARYLVLIHFLYHNWYFH